MLINSHFRRLLLFTLCIFATCGCAITPKEIKALNVRAEVEIDKPYKEAALCLVSAHPKRGDFSEVT